MNWIETTFGVNPDGNSGALEFAVGFGVCLLVVLVSSRRLRAILKRG